MPCINSFFNYELATGARVAAAYTTLLSCPMVAMGVWHNQPNYQYSFYRDNQNMYVRDRHISMGHSYITFSILFLLTSICLLVGVHKKNYRFTWPWLVISSIAMIYFLLLLIIHGFSWQTLLMIEQILLFFGIFIMMMFYVVVISYTQHIRKLYTSQVGVTTNQPETVQPPQYTQIPTINGNNLHPSYSAYPSNPQPPMNIPTTSNSVPPVHFPPLFYPSSTQSNATIKHPNPTFYPQTYSEYGAHPSQHYPVALTPPNHQSASKNSSILPLAPYNTSIPPSAPYNFLITPSAPYDSSIPQLQLQHPRSHENAPSFPDPPVPH